MIISSALTGFEPKSGGYLLHTNGPDILLQFMTPEILRIRASFDKEFREESYVLSTTAWEDRLDPLFEGERTRIEPLHIPARETEAELCFDIAPSGMKLIVTKKPFSIQLLDRDGDLRYLDQKGFSFTLDSNNRRTHNAMCSKNDGFYGFGEKAGHLNKRMQYLRMCTMGVMGWDPELADPLYKHIPFYIRLDSATGKATGMFYHNSGDSTFSLAAETVTLQHSLARFQADTGDIDLFVLTGDKMKDILNNYTLLTGRPVMLPKRALGYQGSGMYYSEQPKGCQKAVLDFVDSVHKQGYPIDGYYVSSGYTAQHGNKRCVFTWNKDRYENPARLVADLKEKGAPAVPNVKPGILLDHPQHQEMLEEGVFIRNSTDTGPEVGNWWGGDGHFWDFTNPVARESWKRRLKESLINIGIRSIWNDDCEHNGIFDKDSICDFDGRKGTVGALRPIMPLMMNKMAKDAILEVDPNARPYLLSRGGFAGIQKYAQTWCGDTATSWRALKFEISTVLGLGLSGVANNGTDIGGFIGNAPEPELWVRWVQNGIFQPRFCIHSANDDHTVTEPWMYPEVNDIIREAFLLRYRFLPYLYSAEYQAHTEGAPIMRPLIYEFQNDPNCMNEDVSFMFGRDILVANVVEKGAQYKDVYLPAGCKWYRWDTLECYEGGRTVRIPVSLETIPMFIREGAIIPMAANRIMSMERDAVTDLRVILAPAAESCYTLYDDDGVSNDFRKGIWHKTHFRVTGGPLVRVDVTKEGSYTDTVKTVQLEMACPEGAPYWVSVGDRLLDRHIQKWDADFAGEGWHYDVSRRALLIRYNNNAGDYTVKASWDFGNLLGH